MWFETIGLTTCRQPNVLAPLEKRTNHAVNLALYNLQHTRRCLPYLSLWNKTLQRQAGAVPRQQEIQRDFKGPLPDVGTQSLVALWFSFQTSALHSIPCNSHLAGARKSGSRPSSAPQKSDSQGPAREGTTCAGMGAHFSCAREGLYRISCIGQAICSTTCHACLVVAPQHGIPAEIQLYVALVFGSPVCMIAVNTGKQRRHNHIYLTEAEKKTLIPTGPKCRPLLRPDFQVTLWNRAAEPWTAVSEEPSWPFAQEET